MKNLTKVFLAMAIAFGFMACGNQTSDEENTQNTDKDSLVAVKPSIAELHAYKAFHHAMYMKKTVHAAGGTNKLLNTKNLPTEGTDAVVTPALDHLYSKAVIDLTNGPVTVEFPEGTNNRYWSIHVTDQEHYTIFDEIRPVGKYVFVRKGKDTEAPEGAKLIESPGDYPHLFIRIQVKTSDDMVNTLAFQEKITLTGKSKPLEFDNPIEFTLATHDIYEQNKGFLDSVKNFNQDDHKRLTAYLVVRSQTIANNIGAFGPIDSEEPNSNNPEIRAAAILGHLGLPGQHAIYIPYVLNCDKEMLKGDKTEVYTFPYKPKGVEEFWSITRYSLITKNTLPDKNDVFNAYNTKPDENGNITITFSAEDPENGTYWMPVNKGEPYYFIARYYKADINNLPPRPCNN